MDVEEPPDAEMPEGEVGAPDASSAEMPEEEEVEAPDANQACASLAQTGNDCRPRSNNRWSDAGSDMDRVQLEYRLG